MSDYRVTHVRKDWQGNITDLGVKDSWELSRDVMIKHIEDGANSFYVLCPQRANIRVAQGTYRKFLKTTADSSTKNNLDNLPPL
ncbi:DUF3892 domain-containing protein [Cellulomonas sp. zg-ZUI222]|uniref:DUF3892 domain-containing protein n=1 Tax=Cellulomonas wangleii TaxID=2816956 RepID=UPI001A94D703|nr:DUF3892 domain-containing protein [Cellulomonas wangleii]MBO0920369.1 DUF3892 domain-containing protein [Cellulomonas wangleii]